MFALIGLASCYLVMPHEEKSFVSWMRSTNQMYTGEEYHLRLSLYLTAARRVQETNKANKGYLLTLNKFACYTPAEYKTLLGHRSIPTDKKFETKKATGNYPSSCDWRDEGIVQSVKDQGNCGSCWAFSVVFAWESQYALVNGKSALPMLSEQNLVDCVSTCYGCDGGDEYIAYDYIIKSQGGLWMNEDDYPYKGVDQSCQFSKSKGVCKMSSYYRPTTSSNEETLAEKCAADGCVSIAIDAGGSDFQLYSSGIYDDSSCSTSLNHAVGLVGYGTASGKDYWIVRNSWGSSWGESGYVRMIRGKNMCGVASDVIIPQA